MSVDEKEAKKKAPGIKLLYLFAGAERKTSVVAYLKQMCDAEGWELEALEIDIKRGDNFDLTRDELQDKIIQDISEGKFHIVICTPPCSTWSRVRMANRRGPPPLRSREHMWGYPWLHKRYRGEVDLGNILVRFSIRVWGAVKSHPKSADGFMVFVFGEHPEDLGVVYREEDAVRLNPASIWQLQELRDLVDDAKSALRTVAIQQCCWGAPSRKPTRLITSSQQVMGWGSNAWPIFDEDGAYLGPLQGDCACEVRTSLARQPGDVAFRTTGSDIYPPRLDEAIAEAIRQHIKDQLLPSPLGGEKEDSSKEEDAINKEAREDDIMEDQWEARETYNHDDDDEEDHGWRDEEGGSYDTRGHGWEEDGVRPGWGDPIKCYYKGKHRTIHDGGGLGSAGRWPVDRRKGLSTFNGKRLEAKCKGLFLEWIRSKEENGESAQAVFWQLASGRARSSPFEGGMKKYRDDLDKELEDMGFRPRRRSGDRCTEVNFRRIKAMLETVDDVDHVWLEEVAARGVELGVDSTMPRVPEVFEKKEKWNLSITDEAFQDTFADNYKSAEENAEDIERQVLEEVEKGSIIKMPLSEAEEKFKGRLAIAALGAVPKEMGSSVVRIVHDGSYSVDVNHRIKVQDRMRFPSIDDASGILNQVEGEVAARGGGARFSLLYDVSGAHKLIPVREQDWGYQAFRLPGEKKGSEVYLHTRGTFGIASAAYFWQRFAAGWVRLAHLVSGKDLGLLHLLFADDGWLTALGNYFWRSQLFWMFFLDLCEIPISWKKVRGGTVVQWIGYQLDVKDFKKGVSDKKVRWIKEWMEKHVSSGGVLGRDLKSALGRFSFVAGALSHVRPFLGPLFAWSARLSPGTFATFPDAIRVLLEFVKGQVEEESMTRPKKMKRGAKEAFRVDAKAEGDHIVIGGWEVMDQETVKKGRWFSIELTRKNAPWAYMKGQPFRNISSLELMAVLVAIILFGDKLEDPEQKKTMTLSASTDNLGNMYVLQHLMSCKYPLSIVVMEVAVQMRKHNLELDLGWVPRGQNVEADALTNGEFEGFDENLRIKKNFEDIQFIVLDKLMKIAGELDEEMKLARSSKEAKGDKPEIDLPKKKRGQTRWEDPW